MALAERKLDWKYDGPLAGGFSEWAARLLAPYLQRHKENPHKEYKQVQDGTGKVVELLPWEVYILDSPLLQRLRYVRQLGVGHYLFPTAGYSRFEHSIGALQTVSELFDGIVRNHRTRPLAAKVADDDELGRIRIIVRLAALLHDVGHCVFSHVSEKFYGRVPEVEKARKAHSRFYQNNLSPSETNSLLILQSPAFLQLLRQARIDSFEYKEESLVYWLSCCIAGSVNRATPFCFAAELINSSVDCDKLDYLTRDAHMAGVPVALDTSRLLSKLRLATIAREGDAPIHSLAIVPSGVRALDELLVSRIFLYDKFYYHPKVMAAEELVRRALHYLTKSIQSLANPSVLIDFGDDEFLAMSPERLGVHFKIEAGDENVVRGCQLLERLRLRDLPRRAFAFASRYLPQVPPVIARLESKGASTAVSESSLRYLELRDLMRLLEGPDGKERLAENIQSYARELNSAADVFVGVQSAQRAAGSLYLPVLLPDETLDERPSFLFKTSEWSEAYALNKETSFVFCSADQVKVHIAAERVLLEKGEFTFAPNSWDIAKLSRKELDAERDALPKSWRAHRLPPNYLRSDSAKKRIQRLREKFASLLNAMDPKLGPQLVEGWIWQFPDADLQESALCLLEHMTYIEPSEIARSFNERLAGNAGLKNAAWVPLRRSSGPGKSADQLIVDLKEVAVAPIRSVIALNDGEIRRRGQVVFFDDSLNSGWQCSRLLESWLGVEAAKNDDDGDPESDKLESIRDALRVVPISFLFYSTHPVGVAALTDTCQRIGLHLAGIHSAIDSSREQYRLAGVQCSSEASRERLVAFLQAKGEELLKLKTAEDAQLWSAERVKTFALGYGGIDLTLAYRHGISASTPVALWRLTTALPTYWLPLFPRKRAPLFEALGASVTEE